MTTVTVRPTMPFFLATPKLVRSRRAVARNRTIPPSNRAPLTLTCAGAGVPCAVTKPVTTQSAPSRRAPWPVKVISGKPRASSSPGERTWASLFAFPEA